MKITAKLTIKLNEYTSIGELLTLAKKEALKAKKNVQKVNAVFKFATINFDLAAREAIFKESDYIVVTHELSNVFSCEVKSHDAKLVPLYGGRPFLNISITLETD